MSQSVHDARVELARRIREVREALYGPQGGPILAEALRLPAGTWFNYEMGVNVPALIILEFIEVTGANPQWLRTGTGARYLRRDLCVETPT